MKRAWRAALVAPAAVLATQYTIVRATNFSGFDEWLCISLASRGLLGIPYAHRPLVFLWTAPGALLIPDDLRGYALAHALYLALAAVLTASIARRLAPRAPLAALLAGAAAAAWAPLDYMRLDTVLLTGYTGFTAATMGALLLFVEGWWRQRPLLAAAGLALAMVNVLGFEGTLPLLAAAPLLAWAGLPMERGAARRLLAWALAWEAGLAAAVTPLLAALATSGPSYQTSALGLDPNPLRVALRMLRQLRAELWPLVSSPLRELALPGVALAVAVFAAAALLVVRGSGSAAAGEDAEGRPALVRLAVLGLALAGLGWIALALSGAVVTPARAQILSGPGVGLLIAGTVGAAASVLPARGRRVLLALAGAWVVAVGTGRTAAMQKEWDAATFWPAQRGLLVQLTTAAPALAPNTLVLLLDEARAFPATFTFHHAIRTVYGEAVRGHVWGGNEFLYGARFDASGVTVEPWPVIRGPWRSPVTHHRYDELVVARLSADGRLALLAEWPDGLPPLPAGASYAPLARIRQDPPPAARRILDRVR